MLFSYALKTAEKALNKYLMLDPETQKRLIPLIGKVVATEFPYFNEQVYWTFHKDGIHLSAKHAEPADVVLKGSPFDYLRVASSDSTTALFDSDISIVGDLDTAQEFKALFAQLDIDWEEQLSHATGDVIAHQIGQFVRSLCNAAKRASSTIQQNISEYVHEEAKLFPPREELQDFFREIDNLRNDVERCEAKIVKLQAKFK